MKKFSIPFAASLAASFLFAMIYAYGASTISTNISTGGTLTVSGVTTLTGAATLSSTLIVGSDGSGTDVTFYTDTAGEELLWDASENKLSIDGANGSTVVDITDGNLVVNDTASTTNLIVGGDSTNGTFAGMIHGDCNLTAVSATASSTVFTNCAATGVRVGDKVFLNATSTITGVRGDIFVVAASSSAADTIGIAIFNAGSEGGAATVDTSFEFWAIR